MNSIRLEMGGVSRGKERPAVLIYKELNRAMTGYECVNLGICNGRCKEERERF